MTRRPCTRCGYDLSGLLSVCPECAWPSEMYTDRARAAVAAANEWSINTANGGAASIFTQPWCVSHEIRPVHLALGIVQGPLGIARHALSQCGVSTEELASTLRAICPIVIWKNRSPKTRLVMSGHTKMLVGTDAPRAAEQAGHAWVGTEHLLLAILRRGPGKVVRCFSKHNARPDNILEAVIRNNAGQTPMQPGEETPPVGA